MNNIDILEEKEKKAIEYLKLVAKERTLIPLCDDIKILLNLVSTLIAENKELKEFKENIEKIDRKQLDKLYEDAQKALKEYRETQNKVAKLEEENKELKERNKRQQENLKIANKKIAAQRGQLMMLNKAYIPKSKVEELLKEIENRNYNDYTGCQDGNEVKYNILLVLQSLLGKE